MAHDLLFRKIPGTTYPGGIVYSIRALSVLLVGTLAACAAKDFQGDDGRLARLLSDREAVWWAWFTNDTTKLQQFLAKEVVAMNSGDSTFQDRAAVLAGARQFVKSGGKLVRVTFPKTEQQVVGECAVLYSTYELELEQKDGKRVVQRGRATEMFVWRNGVWQNSGWHLDSGS
jgi:hypothetical protein